MADGFLRVPKDGLADELWRERRPFSRYEAWEDLLRRAAWADHEVGDIKLWPGAFTASLNDLADAWVWSRARVQRFIDWLDAGGHLRHAGSHTYGPDGRGRVYAVTSLERATPRATKRATQSPEQATTSPPARATPRATKRATPHSGLEEGVEKTIASPSEKVPSWPARAAEIMNTATGGVASIPKLGKLLSPIVKAKGGFDAIESAWSIFCSSPEVQYGAGYFSEHYNRYNGGAPARSPKEQRALDQVANMDPQIQAEVKRLRERMGEEQWGRTVSEAKVHDRWVIPYAYEKFIGGSSGKP
jgi:hypothetical protein